jgi:hypothetical protein
VDGAGAAYVCGRRHLLHAIHHGTLGRVDVVRSLHSLVCLYGDFAAFHLDALGPQSVQV